MDIITTILSVAKSVGVSGTLLVAICQHESLNFQKTYVRFDHGSPSLGICMVKEATAVQMGFEGKTEELMDTRTNAFYAAKYLKFQENQYGKDDWVSQVAAYNSGTYNPSSRVVGCPRNLKYLNLVKAKLPEELRSRLNCGNKEVANE